MKDTTTSEIPDSLDPVTFTIVWDRLLSICNEMGKIIERTGKSEAVCNGQDFGTGLFDREGNLISQGNFSPGHLGSMPFAVTHCLEKYSHDDLERGDAIVVNDSFMGSGHLPDIFLITPIFIENHIEGFAVSVAHHADVGGLSPGSQAVEAEEIYQEGLRLFPTKVVKDGSFESWFLELVRANVRLPNLVIGDLRAQMNSNRRGASLYQALVQDYGRDTLYQVIQEIFDKSEQRIREEIKEMPDGIYSFEDQIDSVGNGEGPVRLAVEITIDNKDIIFDYSGTDSQTSSAINSYINYTRAYCIFTLKAITSSDISNNQGVLRVLQVEAPKGSFTNPKHPAASAARPVINQRLVDVNMGALAQAVPKKVVAASSHFANPNYGGVDPETDETFILYDIIIGGIGGSHQKVGEEGTPASFNISNIPVENHEIKCPITVERCQLVTDSGGAGRNRGALGLLKEITVHSNNVSFTNLTDRDQSRPWGLFGGHSAEPAKTILNPNGESESLHSKGSYELSKGDTVLIQVSGGGGYGHPEERNPQDVLSDVIKGFISKNSAEVEYLVIIKEAAGGLKIDEEATRELRDNHERQG